MVRSHCTLSLAQLATIQYPWTTHVTHVLVCLQSQVHGTAASNLYTLYTLFSSWTCCKSILAIFARAALSTIEACHTIALPCGRTLDPAMDRPGHRPRWGQHMSAAGLPLIGFSVTCGTCHTKTNQRRPAARPPWDFQRFRSGVGPSNALVWLRLLREARKPKKNTWPVLDGRQSLVTFDIFKYMTWVPKWETRNPSQTQSSITLVLLGWSPTWTSMDVRLHATLSLTPANLLAWPLFDVKEEDLCFPKKGVLEPTFPEDADLG